MKKGKIADTLRQIQANTEGLDKSVEAFVSAIARDYPQNIPVAESSYREIELGFVDIILVQTSRSMRK